MVRKGVKAKTGRSRHLPADWHTRAGRLSAPQVAERCVMLMLNEAVRCLDEQVIRSVRDGDIGAVFGIGFPPFLGGPFRYIDSLGAGEVVAIMQRLATQYGSRFTPCERLVEMSKRGESFGKQLQLTCNKKVKAI